MARRTASRGQCRIHRPPCCMRSMLLTWLPNSTTATRQPTHAINSAMATNSSLPPSSTARSSSARRPASPSSVSYTETTAPAELPLHAGIETWDAVRAINIFVDHVHLPDQLRLRFIGDLLHQSGSVRLGAKVI